MTEFLIFGFAFAATAAGVALMRRVGRSARLIDIPNERSSHAVPTMRGGGLAIVIVCLGLYTVLGLVGILTINWSFIIGASMVAAISYLDDLYSLSAWIRLIAHAVAAAILIYGTALDKIHLPGADILAGVGWISHVVWFLWIVWMINAFNFMDGIDGIAGAQGIVAGLGWVAFGILLGDPALYLFGGIIALSCLGFLMHNWSPAAIFMGDVGSAFLGYSLAAMPLTPIGHAKSPGWLMPAALSFLWLFFFDSVYTFVRRAVRGEKVWLAHREHLYQRMVIAGYEHGEVTLLYTALSVFTSVLFFTAYWFRGNAVLLLLFSYLISAFLVMVALLRKKH